MNDLLARIRGAYEGLSPRERVLVFATGIALGVFVVSFAVVRPLLASSANAGNRVVAAETELQAVTRLRAEYDEVNARLAAVEERVRNGPRGEIFTTLETLAREAAVNVDSMEPRTTPASEEYRETKVQVSLKSVSLSQLVTYLHRIEDSEQVLSIKSLRIRTRNDKPELLDVTFSVSSFEPV